MKKILIAILIAVAVIILSPVILGVVWFGGASETPVRSQYHE